MRNLFATRALSPDERLQLLQAFGLLARPVLSSSQQSCLSEMINGPHWRPLRLSGSALAGLFLHHAGQAGIDPALLLEDRESETDSGVSPLAALAMQSIRRAALVEKALKAISDRGVEKMLLLKGEALTWLYPAPGLRYMGDVDLAVLPGDRDRVSDGLRSTGFREVPIGDGGNWIHPSGLMFDLHAAEDALASRIFSMSEPHPRYTHIPGVAWPLPSDHLVVIASHSARHGGTRIWRDICDTQVLIAAPEGSQVAEAALERASEFGSEADVLAIFRFMNSWASPPFPLPDKPDGALPPREAHLCYLRLSLYDDMATDPIPSVAFTLVPTFFDWSHLPQRVTNWLGRWWRSCLSGPAPESVEVYEESAGHSGVGRIPVTNPPALLQLKFQLLWQLIRSGRFLFYCRVFKKQRANRRSSPKLFQLPGPDRG